MQKIVIGQEWKVGFTYIEVEQNNKWIADFDEKWWNAPYKTESEE